MVGTMNRKHSLDILIPTYNRSDVLEKNLRLIASNLSQLGNAEDVRIVVVDNASEDETTKRIEIFAKEFSWINFKLHRNDSNIGLEANIIKSLQLAESPYIMFQGDDDFIPLAYWRKVFEIIDSEDKVGVIIPERKRITTKTSDLGMCKLEHSTKTIRYVSGWKSAWQLAGECNQLSGLVYSKDFLFERWNKMSCHSLYPFMTFAGWSAKKFPSYRVFGVPVLVTEGVRKDWGYGYDGLLGDILVTAQYVAKNNLFQRCIGEAALLWRWRDRIVMYWVMGPDKGNKCIATLLKDDRLLLTTRIILLPLSTILRLKVFILRSTGRLNSPHDPQKTKSVL